MHAQPEANPTHPHQDAWGLPLQAAVCERCDWSYLFPPGEMPTRCPHCFQAALAPLGEFDELPYTRPPELLAPFELPSAALSAAVEGFAKDIPFAPRDLNPQALSRRLQRLYLPVWLVDANVRANWRAEVGFDYQVVSHQARYEQNRGGWSSRQVKEGRVRWEPRLGRLQRRYDNIAAPALEEHASLQAAVGAYDLQSATAYQPEALSGALVRLPDRPPEDSWEAARPAFQAAAAEECRKAASADHVRQFAWSPLYADQNWTLLLLPLYSTFYLDDENQPQAVLLHGQSGRIHGPRRASLKRAQRVSLIVLLVAVGIFLVSALLAGAGVVVPALLAIGALGLALALIVGLGALLPIATVWWFNRKQS